MHNNSILIRWLIFIGAGLMILMVNLDVTIVNLALAAISKNLHAGLSEIQWVVNAYNLAGMLFFIISGKLADNFGIKPILLIGAVIFGIASLISGLAVNMEILIIGRLLQGIGFAFSLSLALLLISNIFPPEKRGFALGMSITLTGLGQALGPTVGGLILHVLSWHWIFLINVPIAVFSFFIILVFVKTPMQKHKQSIDYWGILLLAVGIVCLFLSLNQLTNVNYDITIVSIGFILALVFFIILFFVEIKAHEPLIQFRLFKIRNYTLSIFIRFFYMYSFGTFLFFIPLYLQNILNYSPLIAGFILLIYSAVFGISSPLVGILSDKIGYRLPIIFSTIIAALAFLLMMFITKTTSFYLLITGFVLFGLSVGILIPCTVNSTLSSLPTENSGEGLGMFFTFVLIGYSLGVAISGIQINHISWYDFTKSMQNNLASFSTFQLAKLHHVVNGSQSLQSIARQFSAKQLVSLSQTTKVSFVKGLASVMLVNVILSVIILLMSIALRKIGLNKKAN